MTTRDELLKLPPPDETDALGGYTQRRFNVSTGHTLAVYEWAPDCGAAQATGVAFLLHGVLVHSTFEWLSPDAENHRLLLKGSVVERLLAGGLMVIAHDHPGHGRSTGLHAYIDSHDELRDAALEVVAYYRATPSLSGKRAIVLGMSMGGTVAIRMCEKAPALVDAYALIAPAVRPPDDMFGWYGQFLLLIAPILGATVPKLPVLWLPPSPDPVVRDAVQRDGLVYRGALRVRMGMEFLRVYSEINERAAALQFKAVVVFVGGKDVIVSPDGIKLFVDAIQSEDKTAVVTENMGHDLMREPGCEDVVSKLVQWVIDHAKA